MCTTLHLLLGDWHPHELPDHHITRTHMLTIHRALLEWLIAGTPPDLWQIGLLHQHIHPLVLAHPGPYSLLSINAATSLTKGQPWQPKRSTPVGPPASSDSPSPPDIEPHVFRITALSSVAPAGHLSDPQTISEIRGPHSLRAALPQTSDPAPPESEPPVPIAWSGQISPTHPNPDSGSDMVTMISPVAVNPTNRGLFDDPLPRGAIRMRLAWAKR